MTWHHVCSGLEMNLAHHLDAASKLSPKSAAIALRLLVKAQALLLPEVTHALRTSLQTQSAASEEMSSSDLMVLVTHDTLPQRRERPSVLETANHRMAREWVHEVMTDRELRIFR